MARIQFKKYPLGFWACYPYGISGMTEKEIADMAKMYSMEADKLKSLISEQEMAGMKEDLLKKKAEEFLAEAVKA